MTLSSKQSSHRRAFSDENLSLLNALRSLSTMHFAAEKLCCYKSVHERTGIFRVPLYIYVYKYFFSDFSNKLVVWLCVQNAFEITYFFWIWVISCSPLLLCHYLYTTILLWSNFFIFSWCSMSSDYILALMRISPFSYRGLLSGKKIVLSMVSEIGYRNRIV